MANSSRPQLSLLTNLRQIDTGSSKVKPPPPVVEDEVEPQSVIHIPSGFGTFHGVTEPNHRPTSRVTASQAARPQSSLSQISSVSGPSDNASSISHDSEATADTAVPLSSVSSSFQSDSTIKDESSEIERPNEVRLTL